MNYIYIIIIIIISIIISIISYKYFIGFTPNITKKVALYEDTNYKGKNIELDEGTYFITDIKKNYTSNFIGKSIVVKKGYLVRFVYSPAIIINNESVGAFATPKSMAIPPFSTVDVDNKSTNVNNMYLIEVAKDTVIPLYNDGLDHNYYIYYKYYDYI